MHAKRSYRRKAVTVFCLFVLLLVSSVQLAHSCAKGGGAVPAFGDDRGTVIKDAVCFLCLTSFSADSPSVVIEFVLSQGAEFAAAGAQPHPYQRFHEFVLTIRPPPAA